MMLEVVAVIWGCGWFDTDDGGCGSDLVEIVVI